MRSLTTKRPLLLALVDWWSVMATMPTDRLTRNAYAITMHVKRSSDCLCRSPHGNDAAKRLRRRNIIIRARTRAKITQTVGGFCFSFRKSTFVTIIIVTVESCVLLCTHRCTCPNTWRARYSYFLVSVSTSQRLKSVFGFRARKVYTLQRCKQFTFLISSFRLSYKL